MPLVCLRDGLGVPRFLEARVNRRPSGDCRNEGTNERGGVEVDLQEVVLLGSTKKSL